MTLSTIIEECENPAYILILSHGAGAGMDHPFMTSISKAINELGANVIRFNFGYIDDGRKFPSSSKKSIANIDEMVNHVLETYSSLPIILGGKSYGGRMHSHWLTGHSHERIKGLVYFGFPLHAPGKESKTRAEHLSQINVPQLFIQGTNDKLASNTLIEEVVSGLDWATLHQIEHADHSFKAPKASGRTHQDIIHKLVETSHHWILNQL